MCNIITCMHTESCPPISTLTCCMDDDSVYRAPLGSRMRAANSAIKVLRADMTRPLQPPPSPSPSTSRSPQGGRGQETTKTLKKLDEAWQVRGRRGDNVFIQELKIDVHPWSFAGHLNHRSMPRARANW